jgi:GNAT superfamily N-acetyltransferase
MAVEIRPLALDDVATAERVAWAALGPLVVAGCGPPPDDVRIPRARARIDHALHTDPGGAWVAEEDGELLGVALALVREGVWGLSLLGVVPDRQGQGLGGRLLRAALGHGDGATRGGIIASSPSPAAMRSYARAGFDLRPCVSADGVLDRRGLPAGLQARPGDVDADAETIDAVSRRVRGASYAQDVRAYVERMDGGLLVLPGRGFACHRDGSPAPLCATDPEAAVDLLLSSFATAAPGATVHADFLTAGQDWAIGAALRCGLSLSPDGPMFTRGELGTLTPWVPSGAFL